MIERIERAARRPLPFEASQAPFWDDPYIAEQLLAAHLDETTEAASRPAAAIDRCVAFLLERGLAGPGRRVLDLGCGPGLYAHRLAAAGCQVTGLDLSAGSIAYARSRAAEAGLAIDYRVQDFCTLDAVGVYDLVLQAYGELNTFADPVRDDLLRRIRAALRPGGALVVDVTTPAAHRRTVPSRRIELSGSGFWRPSPHLVLTDTYTYPGDVACEQYVVADDHAGVVTYRMWFHDYTPDTVAPVLRVAGLVVEETWASLTGEPYDADADWFAVLARPTGHAAGSATVTGESALRDPLRTLATSSAAPGPPRPGCRAHESNLAVASWGLERRLTAVVATGDATTVDLCQVHGSALTAGSVDRARRRAAAPRSPPARSGSHAPRWSGLRG